MLRIKLSFASILITALIIPVFSGACIPATSPSISGLTLSSDLSSDFRPIDQKSEFYTDSPQVCCSLNVTGVSENTAVTADWIKGQVSKEAGALISSDRAFCSRDCYIGFKLPAPVGGFVCGDYFIDIFINGRPGASAAFSILRDASLAQPKIISFTATPSRIVAGQPVQLAWKVSGASRIDIRPAPGPVKAEDNVTLTPTQDTFYTLYAANRGGVSSSRLNVAVAPVIKEKADLQITDMWTSGNILAYRVKNSGNADSCPTTTRLYKNGSEVSQDYVGPLAIGEERVEAFQQYHFSPRFNFINSPGASLDTITMRACVNSDEACPESDRSNNCFELVFGK